MQNKINDNIIKTLGIDTLPEDKQKEALEKIGELVYQEVMLRVLDVLSEEEKDEFEKLIEKTPDPELMFSFLALKVPNFEEIVNEETQKLKNETVEIIGDL